MEDQRVILEKLMQAVEVTLAVMAVKESAETTVTLEGLRPEALVQHQVTAEDGAAEMVPEALQAVAEAEPALVAVEAVVEALAVEAVKAVTALIPVMVEAVEVTAMVLVEVQ